MGFPLRKIASVALIDPVFPLWLLLIGQIKYVFIFFKYVFKGKENYSIYNNSIVIPYYFPSF